MNSFARAGNVGASAGWFPRKGWLVFDYNYDRRRHGIPVEPDEVDFESLSERRHSYQVRGGLRDFGGFVEGGVFALSYNDYKARVRVRHVREGARRARHLGQRVQPGGHVVPQPPVIP